MSRFSSKSRYLALKGYATGVAVFESASGRQVARAPGVWNELEFSPDERYLALLSEPRHGSRLSIVDLRHGVTLNFHYPQEHPFGFKFSGSGRWLAMTNGSTVGLWRMRPGSFQRRVIADLLAREAETAERLRKGRAEALAAAAAVYAEKSAALRPAKGEFESAAEYAERMKAADEQDALVKSEGDAEARRVAAAWDLRDRTEGGAAKDVVVPDGYERRIRTDLTGLASELALLEGERS